MLGHLVRTGALVRGLSHSSPAFLAAPSSSFLSLPLLPSLSKLAQEHADRQARTATSATTRLYSSSRNSNSGESGDADTDIFQDWWCLDLTHGKKREAYEDCRLAESVKDEMYLRHKEESWSLEKLANYYKIRQQRALAIITLRELREKDEKEGFEIDYAFENMAVKETDSKYQRGSGERHLKSMPTRPRYVLLHEDEENNYVDFETRVQLESAKEEEKMVSEFKERIEYNTWKTGAELERKVSRHKTAAKRPEGGWTFIIKPLEPNGPEPYAAKADGTKRELTESEQTFLKRQQGRPRPKIPK